MRVDIGRSIAGLGLALLLAGCDPALTGPGAVAPLPGAGGAAIAPRSAESLELEAFYARVEAALLARGLLRGDGGGPDTPFSARDLVDNFVAIALSEELRVTDGAVRPGDKQITLRKWVGPVRVGLHFGDTVPAPVQEADRLFVAGYLQRLARVTGHPIALATADTNFDILVVHEDQRRNLPPMLAAAGLRMRQEIAVSQREMRRDDACAVLTEVQRAMGTIVSALVVVRAEHGDAMRRMCYHEEIAQGLGLFNDSPRARPSIFNDDDEFGRLTTHDEMLLRILYDPRMRPGMNLVEARAVADAIARDMTGES